MTGRKQREKMEKDDSVVHDNKKTTTITSYRLCTIANRIEEKSPNIEKNRKEPKSRLIAQSYTARNVIII